MSSSDAQSLNPDAYYMGIAMAVRAKANCTGNRVGAIIVRDNRVISTGYNGTPEGMKNCTEGGCLRCNNPKNQFPTGVGYDICICVHAEQNSLLSAARFGIAVDGATMYTTMQPCFGCLKESVQANLETIYYLHPWIRTRGDPDLDDKLDSEYAKLESRLHLRHLTLADPNAIWAVSSLRRAAGKPQSQALADEQLSTATQVPDGTKPGDDLASHSSTR